MKKKIKAQGLLDTVPGMMQGVIDKLGELGLAKDMLDTTPIIRKSYAGSEVSEDGENEITSILCTRSVDWDNEIVLPEGVITDIFESNPVILWGHKWSDPPVGSAFKFGMLNDSFAITYKMADTEFGQELYKLILGKHLRTMSIGMLPVEVWAVGTPPHTAYTKAHQEAAGATVIARCIMLEASLCSIPANPDAFIVAAKALSEETRSKLLAEADIPNTPAPATEGTPAPAATKGPRLIARLVAEPENTQAIVQKSIQDALDIMLGKI